MNNQYLAHPIINYVIDPSYKPGIIYLRGEQMKLIIVNTKAGWIVQNTQTYVVVAGPYQFKPQAEAVVAKLGK